MLPHTEKPDTPGCEAGEEHRGPRGDYRKHDLDKAPEFGRGRLCRQGRRPCGAEHEYRREKEGDEGKERRRRGNGVRQEGKEWQVVCGGRDIRDAGTAQSTAICELRVIGLSVSHDGPGLEAFAHERVVALGRIEKGGVGLSGKGGVRVSCKLRVILLLWR